MEADRWLSTDNVRRSRHQFAALIARLSRQCDQIAGLLLQRTSSELAHRALRTSVTSEAKRTLLAESGFTSTRSVWHLSGALARSTSTAVIIEHEQTDCR